MRDVPAFLEPRATRHAAPVAAPRRTAAAWVPGEAGLWIFILGDMTMFGAFFTAFLVQRGQDPALFAHARRALDPAVGAANTVLLLTSSLLVALAVRAFREQADGVRARRLLTAAGTCGAAFGAVKVTEWVTKLHAGHHPGDNLFLTYYYVLTGVHFLHLLIGGGALAYAAARIRRGDASSRVVECCASYWHMVDALWVVIFPVLYLSAT